MKSILYWFVLIVSIAVLVSSCAKSDDSKTASTDNTTSSSDDSSSSSVPRGFVAVGNEGTIVKSTDNGSTFDNGTTTGGATWNQADTGLISDKVREGIASIWNSPREDGADGEFGDNRNLYQLYNAATQYLTSDEQTDKDGGDIGTFESTRFEYANRISGQLLKRFNLASDNPKRLAKMVKAVTVDGVKVENN